MLKRLYIVQLLLIFLTASCADKKQKKVGSPTEIKTKNFFTLELGIVAEKDDLFDFFYIENENQKYSGKRHLFSKVSGSKKLQRIQHKMPLGTYPYNLKVDFGTNKAQKQIQILECIVKYSKQEYRIEGKELHKYFNFHQIKQSQIDSTKYLITFENEVYDPYVTGNEGFKEILNSKI